MTTGAAGIRLWRIEDGETHHVAAENAEEALRIVADAFEHGTLEAYLAEQEPEYDFADMTRPLRVRVTDEVRLDGSWPRGTEFYAEVPVSRFGELPRGLISSTCF